MKKQIVQIFRKLIGKDTVTAGQTDENGFGQKLPVDVDRDTAMPDSMADSIGIDSANVPLQTKTVDWKTFERIVTESLGSERIQGCLLMCNVDRCRDINNIYGRDAGDAVLRYVPEVLCDVFGDNISIGSPGGDGFVLWLKTASVDSADDIRRQIGVVNDRLLHPVGELPPATVSVGAAYVGRDEDYKSLVKRANKALFIVKGNGRCGCEISP